MTTVELNAQEAASFMAWREHQDIFQKLLDIGVFGVRNGHAELHFDNDGNLGSASIHFKVFDRRVIPTAVQVKTVRKVRGTIAV